MKTAADLIAWMCSRLDLQISWSVVKSWWISFAFSTEAVDILFFSQSSCGCRLFKCVWAWLSCPVLTCTAVVGTPCAPRSAYWNVRLIGSAILHSKEETSSACNVGKLRFINSSVCLLLILRKFSCFVCVFVCFFVSGPRSYPVPHRGERVKQRTVHLRNWKHCYSYLVFLDNFYMPVSFFVFVCLSFYLFLTNFVIQFIFRYKTTSLYSAQFSSVWT